MRDIYECQFKSMLKSSGFQDLKDLEDRVCPPYTRHVLMSRSPDERSWRMRVFDDPKRTEELLTLGSADNPHVFGFMEVDIDDAGYLSP